MANGFRPTLLVGIGGTGCRIVDAVWHEAVRNGVLAEGRLAALGFDTDDNDLRRLKSLERRQRIRFSSERSIYRILKDNPEVAAWFVPETRLPAELRNMTMLEGAGQIRMFSRLALHVALKDPQTRLNIETALDRLATFDNRELFEGAIEVLMIGSLAGATGSGAFLQIALLLGELARERGMRAQVRGLFLLPDVFARAGRLPVGQIPNVQANGYASLKELNAVIQHVTGRGSARDLDFEYAPKLRPRPDALPLQSVTLIDFENSNGGNLGPNLLNYTRMAERAAYTLLFSPIGATVSSVGVNDARAKLAAAARGSAELYAGIGVGAVVYPTEDIQRYLAVRLVSESLTGDWLRLDELFRQRLRRFQERREQGDLSAQQPDPGLSYIEDLDALATREPRQPFFREIHARLYPVVEDETGEEVERPQHKSYLDAVETWTIGSFRDASEALKEAHARQPLDSRQLEDRADLVENVRKLERLIERDWRTLEQAARDRPDDLFTTLWSTSETLSEREWLAHHLQFWIAKDGPHLVQVRYFLYAVLRELRLRRDALDVKGRQDRLFGLAARFDKDKPKDSRSTPKLLEAARTASETGLFGRLIGRSLDDFRNRFVDYHNASQRLMREWTEARLKERVYERLEQEIQLLLKVVEELFFAVERLRQELAQELARLRSAHQPQAGFDGNLFIYADPDSKDDIWQRFLEAPGSKRQGPQANAALARALYERYRERRIQRGFVRGDDNAALDLFRRTLVDEFASRLIADEYRAIYDLTIIEAVKREAARTHGDWQRRLREAVYLVGGQAEPFLDFVEATAGQRVKFWAVSPVVEQEFGDAGAFQELFTANQGEAPLLLPEFSASELLCLNTRVNLDLTDLGKLHPGDPEDRNINAPAAGVYFAEYHRLVDPLVEAELAERTVTAAEFTPHIHRDWHKPGVLPEIFRHRQRAFETGLYRGFVTAIATGVLTFEPYYSDVLAVLDLSAKGPGRFELLRGPEVEVKDDWRLLQSLARRPELLRALDRYWQGRQSELTGVTSHGFADAPLVKAVVSPAVTERLLGIATIRQDEVQRDQAVGELLDAQLALVHELVERGAADLAAIGRRDLSIDLARDLGESAMTALAGRPLRPETEAHLKALLNEALARFARSLARQA